MNVSRPPRTRQQSSTSEASLSVDESREVSSSSASSSRPSSRSRSSRPAQALSSPLTTVPKIYFNDQFKLEDPRTFDIVSEKSEILASPPTGHQEKERSGRPERRKERKILGTNAILQEKLSWYLDTVEVHLISSISSASTTFFSALGSLQDLHTEASASVEEIQALRKELSTIDRELALSGLELTGLRRRRGNVLRLSAAAMQLREVLTSVSSCEKMVDEGPSETALDELEDVQRLLIGQAPRRPRPALTDPDTGNEYVIDLRRLNVLDGALNNLDELRDRIGAGYQRQFLDRLLSDLKRHVENVPLEVTLRRLGESFIGTSTTVPEYSNIDESLRSGLDVNLSNLSHARHMMPAANAFQTDVLRDIKSHIRQHLPSSNDDDSISTMSGSAMHANRRLTQKDKSSILARNLRALDNEDAYAMFVKIYANISEALRRLGVQIKILLDITSNLSSRVRSPISSPILSPSRTPLASPSSSRPDGYFHSPQPRSSDHIEGDGDVLGILDLSGLLPHAVDLVLAQVVKILRVRSEQTTALPHDKFLRYFWLNRVFANECEAISGSGGTTMNGGMALKDLVDNQIKEFISKFGDGQVHSLIRAMDADRWDVADFGEESSQAVQRILEMESSEIEAWKSMPTLWGEQGEKENGQSTTVAANGGGDSATSNDEQQSSSTRDRPRHATVNGQVFILTESALHMLRLVQDFLCLMTAMPSMMGDIRPKFFELLKLFNSRSSQLILGAGATRSAGLKNITTKHLALASRALNFILALFPSISSFLRRNSPSADFAVGHDMDRIRQSYEEHCTQINEKLVDIMSSRAAMHMLAMKKIDFDNDDGRKTSPYMEILTKETGTLHRVLQKHLPEDVVSAVVDPVFANYREQMTEALQSIQLRSEHGRERLLSDINLFKTRIDKIAGSGELGQDFVNLVSGKTIFASRTSTTTNPTTPTTTTSSSSVATDLDASKPSSKDKDTSTVADDGQDGNDR